jgi:hypothetical protein
MFAKVFLGISTIAFVGYGLMCLAQPSVVADATGMQLLTGTAVVEVRAMYGGLQIAVGLLALLGLLRADLETQVLVALGLLFFGLASGRLVGIAIDADPGTYNFAAFAFEAVSAGCAMALVSRAAPGERRAA